MVHTRDNKTVYLSQLEDVEVIWRGDMRALAEFLLRSYDAKDREINAQSNRTTQRSRPTLHGLAGHFSMLTGILESRIQAELKANGFNLGATIEFDSTQSETDRA